MEKYVEDTIAGGVWIFLGSVVVSASGFMFWLIATLLVGVENVGIASAAVSSSVIASTMASAGLNIAVVREVAAKGTRAFIASAVLASVLSIVAFALSAILAFSIGSSELSFPASMLALITVLSVPMISSLIGFGMFKEYFKAVLAGSIAKLCIGAILAITGFKAQAIVYGYIAYPLLASITAFLSIYRSIATGGLHVTTDDVRSVASLSLSNYPFVFSAQLLTMLSVYIFAYFVGEAVLTGTLYISMMITIAISTVSGSLLSAALSIGTRRGVEPFAESLRIGLALATPLIALVLAAPRIVLLAINTELAEGADALRILILSLTALAAVSAAIMKLNREKSIGSIAVIGLARLTVLVSLTPMLAKLYGIEGVSIAFLLANLIAFPIAVKHLPGSLSMLVKLWLLHLAIALVSYTIHANELLVAALAIPASFIIVCTQIASLSELKQVLKIAISTLTHGSSSSQ